MNRLEKAAAFGSAMKKATFVAMDGLQAVR